MGYTNYELSRSVLNNFLQKDQCQFFILNGDSGSGKSFLLKKYCEENPSAIYVQIPLTISPRSSLKQLYLQILQAVGVPNVKLNLLGAELTEMIVKWVRFNRIKLIILDEMDNWDPRLESILLESLKVISEESEAKILFAGINKPVFPLLIARRSMHWDLNTAQVVS